MCSRGFSLIEVTVAMACTFVVLLGSAALVQIASNSQNSSQGKFGGIEQRSDIRDLIFSTNNQGTGSQSCVQRLGLQNKTLQIGTPLQLAPSNFPNLNLNVKINKIYLTNTAPAGVSGNNPIYTSQLVVEQQLTRGLASTLAPTTLGTVTITTDPSGQVLACNWDQQTNSPMQICSNTQGTAPVNSVCYLQVSIPTIMTCPTGTSQAQINSSIQHCVPSNVSCYTQSLSNRFNGSALGCSQIPTTYAIRYPSNFNPPNAPNQSIYQQTSAPGTTATSTTTHSATPCSCGNGTLQPGSTQLCIQGYSTASGGFLGIFGGNTYDMWDAQVCNSAGVLQQANPSGYIDSNGNGVSFSWRPGTCNSYGGYSTRGGRQYANGICY